LPLRTACHVTNSDWIVYRYSGSALQRLSVERIAARIPHLEQQHGLSSYIRLSSFYVPRTLNAEDLCCGLQEMPPGCPDRRGRVPVPIHHCGVRVMRRKAPLSAVRGFPWAARSTGGASEADRGELMCRSRCKHAPHQPGKGVPDIRNWRQIDEQSATSRYRSEPGGT